SSAASPVLALTRSRPSAGAWRPSSPPAAPQKPPIRPQGASRMNRLPQGGASQGDPAFTSAMADPTTQTRPAGDAPAQAPSGAQPPPADATADGGARPATGALISVFVVLAVGTAVFLLALNNGSYALTDRLVLAVAIWWAIAMGVGLRLLTLARTPRMAYVAAAGIVVLALF